MDMIGLACFEDGATLKAALRWLESHDYIYCDLSSENTGSVHHQLACLSHSLYADS